jgi:branched-chain amino acid transport system substrate-binding protein
VRCKKATDMRNPADFAEIVATENKQQPTELGECKQMPAL